MIDLIVYYFNVVKMDEGCIVVLVGVKINLLFVIGLSKCFVFFDGCDFD